MTDGSTDSDQTLRLRRWLEETLQIVEQGGAVKRPPLAVIDALVALGLTGYDIGWSEFEHDHRSAETTWRCTLATRQHFVEVKATAQRQDEKVWIGGDRGAVDYAHIPRVCVSVVGLRSVDTVTLLVEDSRDNADAPYPGQQTWHVRFANEVERSYVVNRQEATSADAISALCQRLAANV